MRQAHKEYGVALSVTKPSQEGPAVNLADPLRAVSRAIGRYGVAICGLIDDEPATEAIVRKALLPIDAYREGQARRSSGGGNEGGEGTPPPATPATLVPEVK